MRTLNVPTAALLVAAGVLFVTGCEDTPLVADPDGEMVVTASPAIVVIDEAAGESEGTSTISAQVFDSGGLPMDEVGITFTTGGGTLASGGNPVNTNGSGRATDVLTLGTDDPETVTVTARSAKVTGTVDVTRRLDPPPEAILSVTPANKQRRGLSVQFDGTASDAPGGVITCYQWRFVLNNDQSTLQVIQGGAPVSRPERAFGQLDDFGDDTSDFLTVTLNVSDDPDALTTFCAAGAPIAPTSAFSGIPDTLSNYEIVCDLTDPIQVDAGSPRTVQVLANDQVTVTLSGTGRDDESMVTYRWECGNDAGTVQVGPSPDVTCTYTNTGTSDIVYTGKLTVTNECGRSLSDTVSVTVTP